MTRAQIIATGAAKLKVSVESESLVAAKAYGGIKKVAFISPYYPVAKREVRHYLSDLGIDTLRDECLLCPTWTTIAEVPTKPYMIQC